MPSRFTHLKASAFVDATQSLLDEKVDPDCAEILTKYLQEAGLEEEGRAIEPDEIAEMSKKLSALKIELDGAGVKVAVLGQHYYKPSVRAGFTPRRGDQYPPSFRKQGPVDIDEAALCLPGSGPKRRAAGILWPQDYENDLIWQASLRRAGDRTESQVRGFAKRMHDERHSGRLSVSAVSDVVALIDRRGHDMAVELLTHEAAE